MPYVSLLLNSVLFFYNFDFFAARSFIISVKQSKNCIKTKK